jgi:hypothetical protein
MDGRGTSQFVRPDESVERTVGVVAARLVDPVLTDVRVRVEGNVRLSKMLPGQSTDLFADRDLVVLARYSGHGNARLIVEGMQHGSPVRWTSDVSFASGERENPFVARLWAAQRIGFLSAEKRKAGGSSELDEEVRMLGERYGIPTEFTSYLVTEPRFALNHPGLSPQSLPAPAGFAGARQLVATQPLAQSRDAQFEQAKMASVQRATLSMASLDSAVLPAMNASTRRVMGRSFQLKNGVWIDARYHDGMQTIAIKPFSAAYFDIMDKLPELRGIFALGSRVTVVGRAGAIALTDDGVATLTATALDAITKAW